MNGNRAQEAETAAVSLLKDTNYIPISSSGVHNISTYEKHNRMYSGYSINSIPADEGMIEGVEINGKISAVRRFFCLFVVFDLSFTGLLWLVCIVIGTTDYKKQIVDQITRVSIENSLFDVVLTSLFRSVVLLLMYALLRLSHWWPVAITTTASSLFLIIKIFFFEWQNAYYNNNYVVFAGILILCSFVISWGETWFLDFRVLPQEQRAKELRNQHERRSRSLLPPPVQSYGSVAGTETQTFYSPIHSQDVSEDEEEALSYEARNQHKIQCDEYRQTAVDTLQSALVLFKSDQWTLQKKTARGDEVHSKQMSQPKGKIFRLKTVIPINARNLLNELFYKVEAVSKWNPSVNYSKIIYSIDDQTDITYQVTNDLANGVVSSRDFVSLRRWELHGDMYIIGLSGTTHPSMPPVKDCVRGENKTSGCFITPFGEDQEDCLLEMLCQVDLKGWLPQSLIDQTMTTVLIEYAQHLQNYVSNLSLTQSV